jgi:TetR/AcrR family transcriptional repressor of nem operon
LSHRGDQLVTAARRVIHERGPSATTLAVVASEAKVPLGNVYYYFKTKDELVAAVVESRLAELHAFLARADAEATPVERLCFVVEAFAAGAEDIVQRGCPYGSLASDLPRSDKLGKSDERDGSEAGDVARGSIDASRLFSIQLHWMEAQFRALRARGAKSRASELLCAIQGACLVAHALHDASLFERRLGELARQLRTERHSR